MDRSVAGETKWNSKRRKLLLRVFNNTADIGLHHSGGTLDAAGLSNAGGGGGRRWGAPAGADNGRQSKSFIDRSVDVDESESLPSDRNELTEQLATTTTTTTFGNKQRHNSASQNESGDDNTWRSDRRCGNDGFMNESRLPRLNSGDNKVSSKSYNLPTERNDRVGLLGSNPDFRRRGSLKRNSLLADKYWNSGRIPGYLDSGELRSIRNNEINKTDVDRKRVTGLRFDPLYLPRLNGLDLGPRGVALVADEVQPSCCYIPDRYRSRDRSRDRVTMDSFPPPTPEDLKFLSAKHFLRKLRREKQEADLGRKYGDPEEGDTGVGLPEVDSKAHDDRLDTASTGSTGSTATVYLIRTVKKSSLGPNGGNRHGNGLEHSTPYKRRHVGNPRREIVLEPVQIAARNGGDRRKLGEGQAKDTGEGQRSRTTKTKRVKDSTAQTNDLDCTERDAAEVGAADPVKVIVPRRPTRTIGLQTANQAELSADDATVTSSSSDPRSRRSMGVQTTVTHPINSKTSTGTQTTDADDVTRRHRNARTRDFGAQTDAGSNPLPEVEEAEEIVTSRRQQRHKRTSNVVPDALADLPKANDASTNTKIADFPQDSPEQAIGLTEEGQDMTFYSLQHEVRLLRHENYFLRQQLDYPIKPKGRLQKQNEAKILQIIRRLESKGSKGKMTPQIRDEMINETMIENEMLRAENSSLQATLDQSQRLQEQLVSENDVLQKKLDLLGQPADYTFA